MESQAVANCFWSLGKAAQKIQLHKRDKQFKVVFVRLCREAESECFELSSQGVSNILWAISKVSEKKQNNNYYKKFPTFALILRTGLFEKKLKFKPEELSIVLQSLATVEFDDDDAIQLIIKQTGRNIDSFGAKEISNILWSLKKITILQRIVVRVKQQLPRI
eukprot:TRINITY_DN9990_c0_g1_i2.p1 TRINITY_DN9990_c0_g1~~TRINITY_DN9990_c0_g1_i2.p1  ORF type:complete len:163 (-),score=29.69 TRINITY_DN9990_c0_g1_i2:39-527(-)